jgi:DDE superfamily endonuclease
MAASRRIPRFHVHPNVHFHFTPTRASWLNRVEIWFSILQGKSLHGGSFTSVKQLRKDVDAFIEAYNQNPNHSSGPKPKFTSVASKGTRVMLVSDSEVRTRVRRGPYSCSRN